MADPNQYRPPEDTEDTLYLAGNLGLDFAEIQAFCDKKWPNACIPYSLTITAEHHQVRCFGYDQYDGADWETFIVLKRTVT